MKNIFLVILLLCFSGCKTDFESDCNRPVKLVMLGLEKFSCAMITQEAFVDCIDSSGKEYTLLIPGTTPIGVSRKKGCVEALPVPPIKTYEQ